MGAKSAMAPIVANGCHYLPNFVITDHPEVRRATGGLLLDEDPALQRKPFAQGECVYTLRILDGSFQALGIAVEGGVFRRIHAAPVDE